MEQEDTPPAPDQEAQGVLHFTPRSKRRVKNRTSKTKTEENKKQIRVLGHAVLTKPAYDDCSLLSPEGELMARINIKRFNWYLNRGLATKISDNEIKLNFVPRGNGNANDPFYLEKLSNRCVCCGDESNYTKHHIIPHEYRKHFPKEFKSRSNHDVVLLCAKCHEDYETEAMKFKKEMIVGKMGVDVHGSGITKNVEKAKVKSAANAIKNHYDKLPQDRARDYIILINTFLKKHDFDVVPTKEELEEISNMSDLDGVEDFSSHGEQVVSILIKDHVERRDYEAVTKKLDEFCISWRRHFVQFMKPKYLSEHWSVERSLERT
ncbi:Exd2 [Acrasis kona]|uniref:Exd2 n=1 Tax=Acrasis kona TaxID=1008807 RepID=A0AAW2Z8G6_9EUKA